MAQRRMASGKKMGARRWAGLRRLSIEHRGRNVLFTERNEGKRTQGINHEWTLIDTNTTVEAGFERVKRRGIRGEERVRGGDWQVNILMAKRNFRTSESLLAARAALPGNHFWHCPARVGP